MQMPQPFPSARRKPVAPSHEATPTMLGQGVLERIGNTPLLRMARISRDLRGVEVLAKAEWFNAGGSVKDRAAANIVREALLAGKLTPGRQLLDSTSGTFVGTARRLKELNPDVRCV